MTNRLEVLFPTSFDVANAAAFETISIWCEQTHTQVKRDDTFGATRYTLMLRTMDCIDIFVLAKGESLTAVTYHGRSGAQPLEGSQFASFSSEGAKLIADVIVRVNRSIQFSIRNVDPNYTIRPTPLGPPMPHYTTVGWEKVFEWQAFHASAMTDKELAAHQDVAPQTVANARQDFGYAKTDRGRPRGRPRKK